MSDGPPEELTGTLKRAAAALEAQLVPYLPADRPAAHRP